MEKYFFGWKSPLKYHQKSSSENSVTNKKHHWYLNYLGKLFRRICLLRIFQTGVVSLSCGNFKDAASKKIRNYIWILFTEKSLNFLFFSTDWFFLFQSPFGGQDVGSGSGDLSRGKQKNSFNIINVLDKRFYKVKQGFMIIKLTLFQCEF